MRLPCRTTTALVWVLNAAEYAVLIVVVVLLCATRDEATTVLWDVIVDACAVIKVPWLEVAAVCTTTLDSMLVIFAAKYRFSVVCAAVAVDSVVLRETTAALCTVMVDICDLTEVDSVAFKAPRSAV